MSWTNDVTTCQDALVYWGLCCVEQCSQTATVAALDFRLVEHAMCASCAEDGSRSGDLVAMKPLNWRAS